jgi:putative transposase
MVGPRAKRAAAHQLITDLGLSERKACKIVKLPRSMFRWPLASQTPADPDAGLRT